MLKKIFCKEPSFPLAFFSPISRELTGKLLSSEKKAALKHFHQEAVAIAKSNTPLNSLEPLNMAAMLGCPYSNFILGYLYAQPLVQCLALSKLQYGLYNLNSGSILDRDPTRADDSVVIDLRPFANLIAFNLPKAITYLTTAFEQHNLQGSLYLAYVYYRLACQENSNTHLCSFIKWGQKTLESIGLAHESLPLSDLSQLAIHIPECAHVLINYPGFIESILEQSSHDPFENLEDLVDILCSDIEIAKTFFKNFNYWIQANPYQKAVLIKEVLAIFPSFAAELETLTQSHQCTYN